MTAAAAATLASTTTHPDGNQTVGIASKNAKCPFLCVRPSKPPLPRAHSLPLPAVNTKIFFCLDERPQSKADSIDGEERGSKSVRSLVRAVARYNNRIIPYSSACQPASTRSRWGWMGKNDPRGDPHNMASASAWAETETSNKSGLLTDSVRPPA